MQRKSHISVLYSVQFTLQHWCTLYCTVYIATLLYTVQYRVLLYSVHDGTAAHRTVYSFTSSPLYTYDQFASSSGLLALPHNGHIPCPQKVLAIIENLANKINICYQPVQGRLDFCPSSLCARLFWLKVLFPNGRYFLKLEYSYLVAGIVTFTFNLSS